MLRCQHTVQQNASTPWRHLHATSALHSLVTSPYTCRRQALDFFFTYFHLNYEESLVTSGTTYEQLYQPSEGPDNTAGQTLWILQSYALDPYGTLPSLQRLCGSLGCADISAGQIPIYMGGYQLQIMQPFTAVRPHALL